MHKVVRPTWEKVMKIKMICFAAALSVAAVSQASAGGLFGGRNHGGIGNGAINIAPKIGVLNGSETNILSGILSGNSILNGNSILSGNNGNSLLGLGILSGNNSGNSFRKNVRR
jgi:hypothetical protein